jgi:hypothetical protein
MEMKRDSVQGLEDIHLFTYENKIHFICSTYYTSLNGVDICKGVINLKNENENTIILDDINIIKYLGKQSCEKNWLPFIKDNIIHYIYSQEPLKILSNKNEELKDEITKFNHINVS